MSERQGLLFVISAPSGAGKTSLVAALLRVDPNLRVSISHTTRARRPSEVDGQHYHFIDHAEFTRMVERGEFLEHAEVFGKRYGTAKRSVEVELERGHDVILEIDWQGAQQIRARHPDAVSIFVLPPSRQVLLERLKSRAQDGAEAIRERSRKAVSEMAHYAEFDYLVVNETFDVALGDLQTIIRAARLGQKSQRIALEGLIADLLSSSEPIE
jgi:guanylate kinase